MSKKTDAQATAAEEAVEQTFLSKQVGKESDPQPEQQNVYTQQMSSTETALISNEDFWKIKLHS